MIDDTILGSADVLCHVGTWRLRRYDASLDNGDVRMGAGESARRIVWIIKVRNAKVTKITEKRKNIGKIFNGLLFLFPTDIFIVPRKGRK